MILLWGLPGDSPLAQVQQALERFRCPSVLLHEGAVLETEITGLAADASGGVLRTGGALLDLGSVTAVYLRPYGLDRLPSLARYARDSDQWRRAEALAEALLAWVETTPALVVNPPSSMASNNSKPYQAQLIRESGFQIPETLVTTDEAAVHEFRARHGEIVYKSVSAVRSIVSRLSARHSARLELVRWCPTQFQEYIAGDDYRVHVVGDQVFACRISSSADDYRYAARDGLSVERHAVTLPDEVLDRCRRLAASLALPVAGVDLRCHPERGWYCFEVNPSPAFSYYQKDTGHAIDEAVARLLMGSPEAKRAAAA